MSYRNQKRTDAALQKFSPRFISLITFGGSSSNGGAATFKVRVPDARLRTKVTVAFCPPAGDRALTGLALAGTLILYEADQDQSGVSGTDIRCALIEGTVTAGNVVGTSVPIANGLLGYSREFQTLADYIEGEFSAISNPAGTWNLQVTYSPDGVRFTPDEWDAITQQCGIDFTSGATVHVA